MGPNDFARWGFDHYGWSATTRKNYVSRVRKANKWFLENLNKPLARASAKELQDYFFGSDVKATAGNRYALRHCLMRYFEMVGRKENPALTLPTPKKPQRLPRALKEKQGRRILDEVAAADLETQLFIHLWIYQGLRFTESRMLRWDQIGSRYLHFPGKGDKDRVVGLHRTVKQLLTVWKLQCTCPEWVFPSPVRIGKPVSEAYVRSRVYRVLREARPHVLRHTFATTSLRQKALDIRQLQEVLGHSSLATTEIYLRVWPKEIADGINKLSY